MHGKPALPHGFMEDVGYVRLFRASADSFLPDVFRDDDSRIKLRQQMEAMQRREVKERRNIIDDYEDGGSRFSRLRSSTASALCVP